MWSKTDRFGEEEELKKDAVIPIPANPPVREYKAKAAEEE